MIFKHLNHREEIKVSNSLKSIHQILTMETMSTNLCKIKIGRES
jgi:hypothetical protein